MHPQFPAGTDLARGTVAHNEYLAWHKASLLLDVAEGCFFGQHIATVGVIDLFDRRLAVKSEGFHFGALDFGLAKADDEIPDAAFGQKAQQRE